MSTSGSLCSRQTFKWSEKQLTMEELIESYRELMPFPIMITSGWLSDTDHDQTACRNDVYWAHTAVEQQWIIVSDVEGNRFKVPQHCDAMVIPIKADGKEGAAFPFREVRERGEYQYIRFVESKQLVASDVNGEKKLRDLGQLSVIDVCDVVFVAIHQLRMEHLLGDFNAITRKKSEIISSDFILLPPTTPITVSLGVALDRAPDVIYFHTMSELKMLVDSYGNDYNKPIKHLADNLLEITKCADNNYEYMNFPEEGFRVQPETAGSVSQSTCVRKEPLAPSTNIDPEARLRELSVFYKTGEMSDAAASISHLDAEGYLNPVTWLAVSGSSANQATDEDVAGGNDDACDDEKQEVRSVSWLKKRFENAAKNRNTPVCETHSSRALSAQLKSMKIPVAWLPGGAKPELKPKPFASPLKQVDSSPQVESPITAKTAVVSPITVSPPQSWQTSSTNRIKNITEVPKDISNLGVEDVMNCLRCLNLSAYIPAMRAGLVDGQLLLCLEEEHLTNTFGFNDFEATKLMQFAKHGWRPKN